MTTDFAPNIVNTEEYRRSRGELLRRGAGRDLPLRKPPTMEVGGLRITLRDDLPVTRGAFKQAQPAPPRDFYTAHAAAALRRARWGYATDEQIRAEVKRRELRRASARPVRNVKPPPVKPRPQGGGLTRKQRRMLVNMEADKTRIEGGLRAARLRVAKESLSRSLPVGPSRGKGDIKGKRWPTEPKRGEVPLRRSSDAVKSALVSRVTESTEAHTRLVEALGREIDAGQTPKLERFERIAALGERIREDLVVLGGDTEKLASTGRALESALARMRR